MTITQPQPIPYPPYSGYSYPPPQEWYPPPPPAPPKPTWWKRPWVWLTSLSVAVVVVGGVWGSIAYDTHQQELRVAHEQQVAAQAAEHQRQVEEQARQAAEQAAAQAAAHQAAITEDIRADLQRQLDNDPDMGPYHIVVTEVHLVKADNSHYDGIATVHTNWRGPGRDHSVMLHVTEDDHGLMWHTDPGQFAWLAYE